MMWGNNMRKYSIATIMSSLLCLGPRVCAETPQQEYDGLFGKEERLAMAGGKEESRLALAQRIVDTMREGSGKSLKPEMLSVPGRQGVGTRRWEE